MSTSSRLSQFPPSLRRVAFVVLALALPLSRGLADPKGDLAHNATIRSQAVQLFRQGRGNDAVAHLQANVHANSRGGDQRLEAAQQLSDIAFYFFGHKELNQAADAARSGLFAAQPLLHMGNADDNRAALFCNLGLAADKILHDLAVSRECYAAALVAEPANDLAKQRLEMLDEKLRWKNKS